MERFEAYTKLFHRILQSSVWGLPDRIRIVWITLLAMANNKGEVISTVEYLARQARLEHYISDVRKALELFMAPDPESLTSAHKGRRLERIEGGWRLLNFEKYRDLMKQEARRESWRESKRKSREKSEPLRNPRTGRLEGLRQRVERTARDTIKEERKAGLAAPDYDADQAAGILSEPADGREGAAT